MNKSYQFSYQFLVLTTFVGLFTACMEVSDKSEGPPLTPPTSPTPTSAVSQEEEPNVQILQGSEPNSYRVQLLIPKDATAIRRTNGAESMEIQIPRGETKFIDTNVKPAQSYEYSFGHFEEGTWIPSHSLSIRVPIDLVLEGEISIGGDEPFIEWKDFERVYLRRNLVITTNGHNLFIQGKMLTSDEAMIRTFPPKQLAPPSIKGRSGGSIRFQFQQAKGVLRLELRGESGGVGIDGNAYTKPAADGQNVLSDLVPDNHAGYHEVCSGEPPGAGTQGLRGNRGGDGGLGGNTGSFQLVADEFKDFQLRDLREPGLGGRAGLGGAGQSGGRGGKSCSGVTAPNGKDGETGEPGRAGANGIHEAICISQPGQLASCR